MKIEGTGKPIAPSATGEARPRNPANPASTVASGADKVQLSSLSSSLQKAESAIAQAPVVDTQRVAEIKQAIANGEFKIDAGRIADGLINSVREMLAGQR
ncbi:flagellar biosynthesis anti-sigma factor FlgM [Thauera sp.]|jgi:negative regulator of flagellin synthesis FlgM|uniref:flagellar biosynthesis anti-sigma factor FlgM n=1 Tax=Thauera sp. TaxID=1905334 RepID=UPI002A36E0E3|nr:flagellar biosynthesis anti-sigma factor FlgM [Thauera sp.]MDX9884915.1 flagellar biosynthesis anti-sigma factor FlgM [Thauera sp.]